MRDEPIYLDNHATTQVDPRVLQAMLPYLSSRVGNPSSVSHAHGRAANEAVEHARSQVAKLLASQTNEVVFTSGATESNQLAIAGAITATRGESLRRVHAVTATTEHPSVLGPLAALERNGLEVTRVKVASDGGVMLGALRSSMQASTALVSVMACNNEIGVTQEISSIAQIAKEHGALMHCDAAQGLGYISASFFDCGADLVSLSAHKVYGPQGVGALIVRRSVTHLDRIAPVSHGGRQERGLRAGTLNVPGIVGFGEACAIMSEQGTHEAARIAVQRDTLLEKLRHDLTGVHVHGSIDDSAGARWPRRHPGHLSVWFEGVSGRGLLARVASEISVSAGSACATGTTEPSHVLRALGVPKEALDSTLRFGIGRWTTNDDVARAAEVVVDTVRTLRS